ncbi:MAG: DUF6690 family protein [Planctomycetota bacterium]
MMARSLGLAGLLGAAVGGPYVVSQANNGNLESPWGSPQAAEPATPDTVAVPAFDRSALEDPNGPGAEVYKSPAALAGPVGITLEQALDWNITKNWVYRHWARKSTGLADPTLFGVRVPLVTGSGMTDVAGSMTYYFDNAGVLQRMRLRGLTADTSRIVHFATTRLGMQPRQPFSPGDQLFQAIEIKRLRAELQTTPESVLWATQPHGSFGVRLEATRPGSDYYVTPQVPEFRVPTPDGVAITRATPTNQATEAGKPFLPPRSVVPDGAPKTAQPSGSIGPTGSAEAAPGGPSVPKLGKPTAAPPPAIAPLDGHRNRFRWPG